MSTNHPTKFLVFGAGSHIGGPAAKHLAMRRPEAAIRLVTSQESKVDAIRAEHPDAEVVVANYLNPESLRAAFDGIEAAFVITPDFNLDETTAMSNVVHAIEQARSLVRVVRLTGDPPGFRDESQVIDLFPPMQKWDTGTCVIHLRGRKVLSASSVPVVYLNVLAWMFQDFSNYMWPSIAKRRTLIMPVEREMNFIDAGDVGRAAAELMLDPSLTKVGETYHVVNGIDQSRFADLAALMTEAFGEKIEFETSEEAFIAELGEAWRSYYGFGQAAEYFAEYCKFEEAFISSMGDTPWETMLGSEALITPEQLGFKPTPFRDWLIANRDSFIRSADASVG
ncbi:SDR family oxidoreductase [Nocardia sp. NPDC059246]|uniref:SDR family oxidoreductase n=1 Tax=unclassified Nocardia TaxID=2637762 RepID=UPI0036D07B70